MNSTLAWQASLRNQRQVLHALILHDIKSRFFGNGMGYAVSILWPGIHMLVVVVSFSLGGRLFYGSSAVLFAATGVLPYICWNYISRFSMLAVIMNKNFLQYPMIGFLDLVFARIFLEIVTSSIVTFVMFLVLTLMQIDVVPADPGQAFLGLLSSVFLGVGFGVLGAVITRMMPMFNIVYILFLIGFWITSGVAFNPEGLPAEYGYMLSWNPLMHCIEWVRSAYYVDYPHRLLDKQYVVSVAFGALSLGLFLERPLRRFSA